MQPLASENKHPRYGVGGYCRSGRFGIGGAITLMGCFASIALLHSPALAQIMPDATLGVESSMRKCNLEVQGVYLLTLLLAALPGT
jgi:hypothetical protein